MSDPISLILNLIDSAVLRNQSTTGVHTIELCIPPQYAPIEAERMLSKYGIAVYNRRILLIDKERGIKEISFDVRGGQRKWAEYLLLSTDMGILSPLHPANVKHRNRKTQRPDRRWSTKRARSGTPYDYILRIFDSLFGQN